MRIHAAPILPDYLVPSLRAVFVGTAAGDRSASAKHYYAGAGNEFWLLLHEAGLTDEYLGPERDAEILNHGFGLTDIAKRRSASRDSLLAASDFDVPGFVVKVERYAPTWLAFHGKAAAKEVSRSLGLGRNIRLGRQIWTVAGVKVFVLPSASGSNRDPLRLEGKTSRVAWFREFARLLEPSRPPNRRRGITLNTFSASLVGTSPERRSRSLIPRLEGAPGARASPRGRDNVMDVQPRRDDGATVYRC